MNLFSRLKSERDNVALLFDIGNASVGAALVTLSPLGKPKIIYTCREPIATEKELEIPRLLPRMAKALATVAETVAKDGFKKLPPGSITVPKEIYCILAAPWSISRTRILKVKKPDPFLVTVDLLEQITSIEGDGFDKSIKDEPDRENLGRGPLVLIEKKVIKTRLNGYEAQDPFEKKVTRLEVSLFLSATTRVVEETIQKTLQRVFTFEHLNFNSYGLIAYSALRDVFPKKEDFLFMDVSGEVTEIALVRNHVLLETISFPYGKNAILRRLSRNFHKEPSLIESDLSLYFKGALDPSPSDKIKDSLEAAGTEWVKLFEKAIRNLSQSDFVPTTIFFTADYPVGDFFTTAIQNVKVEEFSLEGQGFAVTQIKNDTLRLFVETTAGTETDEFLVLESLFLRRIVLLRIPFLHSLV